MVAITIISTTVGSKTISTTRQFGIPEPDSLEHKLTLPERLTSCGSLYPIVDVITLDWRTSSRAIANTTNGVTGT